MHLNWHAHNFGGTQIRISWYESDIIQCTYQPHFNLFRYVFFVNHLNQTESRFAWHIEEKCCFLNMARLQSLSRRLILNLKKIVRLYCVFCLYLNISPFRSASWPFGTDKVYKTDWILQNSDQKVTERFHLWKKYCVDHQNEMSIFQASLVFILVSKL